MDGFTWSLRVLATGQGRPKALVRRQQFEVGAPLHFDEEYDGVTALEYLLAAVGADLVNGFQAVARRRRVQVDRLEALVSGQLNNSLSYLGVVGEAGHPGVERLDVRVYVGSDDEEERIRAVWEETLKKSPLANTLRGAMQLDLRLDVVP